jgi:hypothetical protein
MRIHALRRADEIESSQSEPDECADARRPHEQAMLIRPDVQTRAASRAA